MSCDCPGRETFLEPISIEDTQQLQQDSLAVLKRANLSDVAGSFRIGVCTTPYGNTYYSVFCTDQGVVQLHVPFPEEDVVVRLNSVSALVPGLNIEITIVYLSETETQPLSPLSAKASITWLGVSPKPKPPFKSVPFFRIESQKQGSDETLLKCLRKCAITGGIPCIFPCMTDVTTCLICLGVAAAVCVVQCKMKD